MVKMVFADFFFTLLLLLLLTNNFQNLTNPNLLENAMNERFFQQLSG